MSLRNKAFPFAMLLIAVPLSHAGITDIAKKTEPTKIESMARVAKDPNADNQFSCWQEGRLIFQKKGMKSAAGKDFKPTVQFGGGGKSIELMDFKNGLCIFERHNGS